MAEGLCGLRFRYSGGFFHLALLEQSVVRGQLVQTDHDCAMLLAGSLLGLPSQGSRGAYA